MRRLAIVLFVVIATAMAVVLFSMHKSNVLLARARMINVGDSKVTVTSAIGEPDEVFLPGANQKTTGLYLGVHSETWAYGGYFKRRHTTLSSFPYYYPFKVRLFGPDEEDVAVEFDSAGKVRRVLLPK